MRGKVVGLVAGAALLAPVGITNANAKGPVQLTDAQPDKITAGDSASIPASSTQLLNTLPKPRLAGRDSANSARKALILLLF